jgi:hypothetical protein
MKNIFLQFKIKIVFLVVKNNNKKINMSSSTTNLPFKSYFLNNSNIDRVKDTNDIDRNRNYLIIQVEQLTNEVKDLQQINNELTMKNNDLEEEHDTWDERNRNIRNELKNLVELNKLYESKTHIYKNNKNYKDEERDKLMYMISKSYGIVFGNILSYMLYIFVTKQYGLLIFICSFIPIYILDIYYNVINYRKIISKQKLVLSSESKAIDTINKDIDELKRMNDWVTNYIDSL